MSPEDELVTIEAIHAVTSLLGDLRAQMIEKGWSEHGAEQAALLVYQVATRPPSIFG